MKEDPRIPDNLLNRITKDFLTTFKRELDKTFSKFNKLKPTYWNFYQWFDDSSGYYDSLISACKLHNFMDLFNYIKSIDIEDRYSLCVELTELLHKNEIIEEGSQDDALPVPWFA